MMTVMREQVISNGQRATHLQRIELAVLVCDLAATASAYLRAVSQVGQVAVDHLTDVRPQLTEFAALVQKLEAAPPETRPYRSLIPAQLWQQGVSRLNLDDLHKLDKTLLHALAQIDSGASETADLDELANRLDGISAAFTQLGLAELDIVVYGSENAE